MNIIRKKIKLTTITQHTEVRETGREKKIEWVSGRLINIAKWQFSCCRIIFHKGKARGCTRTAVCVARALSEELNSRLCVDMFTSEIYTFFGMKWDSPRPIHAFIAVDICVKTLQPLLPLSHIWGYCKY